MVVETPSAPTLDLAALREDFPILRRRINGRPLVYLDNAATSQKPRQVLDTLVHFYEHSNANIHRGVHTLGAEATGAYERTRTLVADLIGAASSEEVIFTRNTTEAINLVAYTWALEALQPGDEIVVTRLEHHSNLVPWLRFAQEREAVLRVIELTPDGRLDLDPLDELLTERTKLVAVGHASNVLGTIAPVEELARRTHAVGACLLVDAAQSVPHQPVNVQELGCDFLAFSAHKMLGPTGVGVLWARQELLEAMPPFPRRRQHDRPGDAGPRDLERAPVQAGGRDAEHRRRGGLRDRHRVSATGRDGGGTHPRARPAGLRAGAASGSPGA